MTILFFSITFKYVNVLPRGQFTKTFDKYTIRYVSFAFAVRALTADLLNSGPSVLYMWGYRCIEDYHVYCYMDEYINYGQKWGPSIWLHNILFIN